MNRYQIRYNTDSNYNIRFAVHRGRTVEEAKQKFLRMMKTMNLSEYNIEIHSIVELENVI